MNKKKECSENSSTDQIGGNGNSPQNRVNPDPQDSVNPNSYLPPYGVENFNPVIPNNTMNTQSQSTQQPQRQQQQQQQYSGNPGQNGCFPQPTPPNQSFQQFLQSNGIFPQQQRTPNMNYPQTIPQQQLPQPPPQSQPVYGKFVPVTPHPDQIGFMRFPQRMPVPSNSCSQNEHQVDLTSPQKPSINLSGRQWKQIKQNREDWPSSEPPQVFHFGGNNKVEPPINPIPRRPQNDTWTEEDDKKLVSSVSGGRCTFVPVLAGLPDKSASACKRRWDEINPERNFSIEENKFIIEYVEEFGKDWETISESLIWRKKEIVEDHYESELKNTVYIFKKEIVNAHNSKNGKLVEGRKSIIIHLNGVFMRVWVVFRNEKDENGEINNNNNNSSGGSSSNRNGNKHSNF